MPPSTTARVMAVKITSTAKRKIGTTHGGNPDCHSQTPITARPAGKPQTAVRKERTSLPSSTVGSPVKALRQAARRCLRATHRLESASTIMAPMAWCARYGPTELAKRLRVSGLLRPTMAKTPRSRVESKKNPQNPRAISRLSR